MAMRAARGQISEYKYILDNATCSDLALSLDTLRLEEIARLLQSGFLDETSAKNLEREYGILSSGTNDSQEKNMNAEGMLMSGGVQGMGFGAPLPMG